MAKQTVERNHRGEKDSKLNEYAGYLRQTAGKAEDRGARRSGSEAASQGALAQEVAGKYAELEAAIKAADSVIAEYDKSIEALKQKITAGESGLRTLSQRADTVKAKQHVINASAAVSAATAVPTHAA